MSQDPTTDRRVPPSRPVRCWQCARKAAADAPGCPRCGATFLALCACGGTFSVFAERCPRCEAPHLPKRAPRSKLPAVRAARWALAVTAVGAAAWIAFSRRPAPAWRLAADAADALSAHDYQRAFRSARALTEEAPSDARGWMLLAVSLRSLGMEPDSWVDAAEQAVRLQPGMFEARQLLALRALETGRTAEALRHATAAGSDLGADARAYLFLARVELAQPRPDLARARAAVERARRAGRSDPETNVLLADLCLRTTGVAVHSGARLPAGMDRLLRDAAGSLPVLSASGRDDPGLADARVRLRLALGENAEALAEAERALAGLDPSASPRQRAALEVDRGMALWAGGRGVEATRDFVAALARSPDVATANEIATYLRQSGDPAGAETIFANALRSGDRHGAIHAVLAQVQLDAGRLDEAAASIAAARTADPKNAGFAAIEAAVRASQGRWDDARAALTDATVLAPDVLAARIDLIVLETERPATREAREAALRTARVALQKMSNEMRGDPAVLRALGRVRREQGDAEAAAEILRRAADAAPWDPETWRELGETLLVARPVRAEGGSDDGAADDAARAAADVFARAAALKPQDSSLRLREADARLAAGDPAGAVAALDECFRAALRTKDAALRRRAAANSRLGAWRSVAADLEQLRAAAPRDPYVVIHLVDALFRSGNTQAARRLVADAAGVQNEDVRRVLEFIDAMYAGPPRDAFDKLAAAPSSRLVAEFQLAGGRVDDALRALRAVVAADAADGEAVRLLVLALLDGEPPDAARLAEAEKLAERFAADPRPGLADFVRGRVLLAQGDARGAQARFAAAETANPTDPYAAMLRGEALFRSGDHGTGLRSMRRALGLSGAPPAFRRILAARVLTASTETSDLSRAYRLAEEAFRLAPELPAAGIRFGELLSSRGDFAASATVLEGTLLSPELTPDLRVPVRFTAAVQRFLAGDARRARTLLEGLPADARAAQPSRLLDGCIALQDRRLDDADAAFAEALRLDPTSAAAASGLVEVALARGRADEARRRVDAFAGGEARRSWLLARVARVFLRAGYTDDARALARRAVEVSRSDASIVLDTAAVLARSGDAAEAVTSLLERAKTSSPAEAESLRLLAGRIAARLPGRAAEAAALARELQDSPAASAAGRREALLLEAEALLCAGDLAGAIAKARPLLPAAADEVPSTSYERTFHARLTHTLGTALSSTEGGGPEATRLLTRAVELDPENEGAMNNLAWLLSQSSSTAQRGLELARRATVVDPSNATFWDTRAACAAAASEDDEAEKSWRKALALNASSGAPDRAFAAQANLALGRFLVSRGRRTEAREPLEASLRDAPSGPSADEARRLLDK